MIIPLVCFLLAPMFAWGSDNPVDAEKYWPQWRGPSANGVSYTANPPVEWNERKNLRWKVDIPGKGHASPVVWGGRVFVLTAIETVPRLEEETAPPQRGERRRGPRSLKPTGAMQFAILALSRQDGKVLWKKVVREEQPHEGVHKTASWASNSPVTDGEHIYASFGSRGLYCLDMDGNLQWERDLGDMTVRRGFGEGSSPAIHGDRIVVNWDHEGQSFIVALDQEHGRGALAGRSRRNHLLVNTSHPREPGRSPGHYQRYEKHPQLRPRYGRADLAVHRHDDERYPVTCRCRRYGLSDQRLPRQCAASHPPVRGPGRPGRQRRYRLDP